MSAHPSRRSLLASRRCGAAPDEQAVSTVLGAILMFGLLVTTLTVIQVKFVPIWDKQRERDAGIEVASQVAAIKADLDRIAHNQTTVALSQTVSLTRPQGFSFFGSQLLPGSVTFTPVSAGAGLTMSTARPLSLQQAGGQPLYALNEDWSWTGTQRTGILDIEHLRVRIPNPGGLPTGTQTFSLIVRDTNDLCRAEARIVATGTTATTKSLEAQLYPAQSPAVAACAAAPIATTTTYIGLAAPAYYYLDLFDASFGFGAPLGIVPASQFPLKVSFTQGNTGAQVAMVYDQATGFGTVRMGGAGIEYPTFNQFTATGTLDVLLNHNRLPSQHYGLEYGAVFLTQDDGSAMVVPPAFTVTGSATQGAVAWSYPALSGGSAAVTAARNAIVTATPAGGQQTLQGTAQDITFTVTTEHPEAWTSFWDARMRLAGFSSTAIAPPANCLVLTASPNYTVSSTATTATLNFFGPCGAGTDTTKDVLVTLQQGNVAVTLQPSG